MTVDWRTARAGTLIRAGIGTSTVLADFDFETYSEAGYLWVPPDAAGEWIWTEHKKRGSGLRTGEWVYRKNYGKWGSLPGLSNQNRGLTAVGTRNYVQHPSFRVLSLAWNLKDGRGERWWRPVELEDLFPVTRSGIYTSPWEPGELYDHIRSQRLIEAWGAFFEWQVWMYHMVPFFDAPPLPQRQMRCAMVKARESSYPAALAEFGKVLRLTERKDPKGDALIRKLTVPKAPAKGNEDLRWTPLTAREDFQQFYEYNRQDIRTEAEGSSRVPDLNARELPLWLFDFRCNMRGMGIDSRSVDDCIAIIEQCILKSNAELQQLTAYHVMAYTEVTKILAWCARRGVSLPELDEEALEEALTRKDYPRAVLRVLRIRQTMAFGSVKKYFALRAQTVHPESRLYDQYAFASAHTKLWNSRGVQVMNLYKGIFSQPEEVEHALSIIRMRCAELLDYEYGPGSSWVAAGNKPADALEIIASCLRSMICAAPGHKLISADFSAIQAVAVACMANEQWLIDVFRTHGKVYETMAAKLRGTSLQYYLDYEEQYGKQHEDRQKYGKLPVLSGFFAAWINGWRKLDKEDCLGDDDDVKRLILQFRDGVPNVCNLWGGQTWRKFKDDECPRLFGLEGAIVSAILQPGVCFSSSPGSPLGVLYQMHEDVLYCLPPSGGYMLYHSPRLYPSERNGARPWEYRIVYEGWNSNQAKGKGGWVPMDLYGGVATQNVASNMCREVQADALLALDTAQPREYPIVMHTHDDGVAEVPDRPEYNAAEYTGIVRASLPAWAKCLDGQPWPIKVPLAWEAYRVGKWERKKTVAS